MSSTAMTMPGCGAAASSVAGPCPADPCPAASSVFSTQTGCTVSPLTSSAPAAKCSRASQSE